MLAYYNGIVISPREFRGKINSRSHQSSLSRLFPTRRFGRVATWDCPNSSWDVPLSTMPITSRPLVCHPLHHAKNPFLHTSWHDKRHISPLRGTPVCIQGLDPPPSGYDESKSKSPTPSTNRIPPRSNICIEKQFTFIDIPHQRTTFPSWKSPSRELGVSLALPLART